jgi:folate-binding protein YgfZ
MTSPVLIERSRGLLRVGGRDPVRMIQGLATADINAVTRERGAYTTFLTAKGKMVADARVFLRGGGQPPDLLLDVAPPALAPLLEHIRRFVPPLFARAEDVSEEWAILGVYGPGAGGVVARLARGASPGAAPGATPGASPGASPGMEAPGETGLGPGSGLTSAPGQTGLGPGSGLESAPEETVLELELGGRGSAAEAGDDGSFAVRTGITGEEGWDVFVPAGRRDAALDILLEGARPASADVLESLRVMAGRARWGAELTEDVIPLEAGLLDRAISQSKGCYTGQEVIVRILHRGHVNRHLRRLVFEAGAPEPGAELFEPGNERPRGVVTSAVANEAGALGLGYVRREVEPPAELHVGAPDGPLVRVEALG